MKAEILAVGTELLLGDILNTNAQYLSKRLADLGISVYYQTVVGDNESRLKKAYELAFSRAELVIATGGLGPTKDDLTKEIAAEYFSKGLILHDESLIRIEDYFKKLNRPMNDGNRKQAFIPEGSYVLQNDNGTAPGCIINENSKMLILLPGPPKEMAPMFEDYVVPYLQKFQDSVMVSKVLRIFGIGEGHMAEKIDDIIEAQTNPTVAPYAKEGDVTLRITAKAKNENEAKVLIEPMETAIRSRIGEYIYGEGDTNLETVVANLLLEKELTIATAESCTGGMLSGRLVNYPGISEIFMEGAVTYSNDAKMRRLGVKESTLQKYGAVSEQTAAEMAEGIAKEADTNIGVSTTGIAGPGGGTEQKPVGLVYLGLYFNGITKTKELRLSGNRQRIRERTVMEALDWLRREILSK